MHLPQNPRYPRNLSVRGIGSVVQGQAASQTVATLSIASNNCVSTVSRKEVHIEDTIGLGWTTGGRLGRVAVSGTTIVRERMSVQIRNEGIIA